MELGIRLDDVLKRIEAYPISRVMSIGFKNYVLAGSHDAMTLLSDVPCYIVTCKNQNINPLIHLQDYEEQIFCCCAYSCIF